MHAKQFRFYFERFFVSNVAFVKFLRSKFFFIFSSSLSYFSFISLFTKKTRLNKWKRKFLKKLLKLILKIVAKTFRECDRKISNVVVNNKSRKKIRYTFETCNAIKITNVLNLKILKTTIFNDIFANELVFNWINDKINNVIK